MQIRRADIIAILLLLLAACGSDDDQRAAAPTPVPSEFGTCVIDDVLGFFSPAAVVSTPLALFRLTFGLRGGVQLAAEAPDGLRFTSGGREYAVGVVRVHTQHDRSLILDVDTDAGPGRIELTWRTDRTLEVRFIPPDPEKITQFSDAYALTDGELIYGLTERLTRLAADQRAARVPTVDDLARGGRLARSARRDGRDVRAADLRRSTRRSFRARTATGSSRRHGARRLRPRPHRSGDAALPLRGGDERGEPALAYFLFAGPEHADDSRRVHGPHRPALRAAGLGVPPLALARRAARGAPAMLDGVAGQRRASPMT